MNASSDAARTSFVSPPIATPERREREPRANASATQPRRASGSSPGRGTPTSTASITAASAHAHSAGQPDLLRQQPACGTPDRARAGRTRSPRAPARACRRPAAGSRTSARSPPRPRPRTRRARCPCPSIAVSLTCDRLAIDARIGLETSRFSAASRAKRDDLLERRTGRGVLRQPRQRRLDDPLRVAQAEDVDLADHGQVDRAARHDQVQVARRLLEDLVAERLVGVGERGVDRRLDVAPLQRVLGVVVDLDRGGGRRRRGPASPGGGRSRPAGSRARPAPRRTRPWRSPPRGCRRGSGRRA